MPGPLILDGEDDESALSLQGHLGAAAIFDGVVDQVGDRPAQCRRPAGDGDAADPGIGHRGPGVRGVLADTLGEGVEVDEGARLTLGVVAGEGEDRVEHRAHRVDLAGHFLSLLRALADLEAQFQTGQRGAQIMRDRGQHLHAVVVEAAQALLHPVEGIDRDLQLARPLRRQQRRVAAGAELLDGACQLGQRVGQPPRRQNGQQDYENRCETKPGAKGSMREFGRGPTRQRR